MNFNKILYDKQDYDLLNMVELAINNIKEKDIAIDHFYACMHPHGIKQLRISQDMRIAYTVINLLNLLEQGEANERVQALSSLYEEVISVADSTFRFNTGRVLIQIMKDLVRTRDNKNKKLELAHTFRKASRGNPRFIRKILKKYNLLEMPETWNQLTFDDHVHDSYTKGKKTPSHLIMDAWIKGIRTLTVTYYNYIEIDNIKELFEAAKIMKIDVRVGVEFKAIFRDKDITLLWEPPNSNDYNLLERFLDRDIVKDWMDEGRNYTRYYRDNVVAVLHRYNKIYAKDISELYNVDLKEIKEEELFEFIGMGQPSLLHLADLIYQNLNILLSSSFEKLKYKYENSSSYGERINIEKMVKRINDLSPELILNRWLIQGKSIIDSHENIKDPAINNTGLIKRDAIKVIKQLHKSIGRSRITISLANITPLDILEIIYKGQGAITHLEVFNMRDYNLGKLSHLPSISQLLAAINQGNTVVLKYIILDLIKLLPVQKDKRDDRRDAIVEILHNIPYLQSFYRNIPIKSSIGSNSTNRIDTPFGTGFAYTQTLGRAARKQIREQKNGLWSFIPVQASLCKVIRYYNHTRKAIKDDNINKAFRGIKSFSNTHGSRTDSWEVEQDSIEYNDKASSIINLGGIRKSNKNNNFLLNAQKYEKEYSKLDYLNTSLINFLKIFVGFVPAYITFIHTQSFWFLAFFGAPLWFIITGVRNILQAVLAGNGLTRYSLLRWKDYINWSRISDSLMYTGLSVPLLELVVRILILNNLFGINSENKPMLFFTIVSIINGFYIALHNIFRGLQKEAIIGNIFRSALSIPLSLVYNSLLTTFLSLPIISAPIELIVAGSAITSKAASDTVAGLIEGFADRKTNLNKRKWDYTGKLKKLFNDYSTLETLLPEGDIYREFIKSDRSFNPINSKIGIAERTIVIHALDLMYFILYQPRARDIICQYIKRMTENEKNILRSTQMILNRDEEIISFIKSGRIFNNYNNLLEFYIKYYKDYINIMERMIK